jgi:hypothetical protein
VNLTKRAQPMAGLLAIFAEFEREILRETSSGWLGPRLAEREETVPTATAAAHTAEIRKQHRAGPASPRSSAGCRSAVTRSAGFWLTYFQQEIE